jgi:ABC-type Na+ transport system ATPase subunit NatA
MKPEKAKNQVSSGNRDLVGPTRGAQIDLVFDRDDGIVSICEIKYDKEVFVVTKDYASVLEHKMNLYKEITQTKKSLFLAMITVHGLADNPQVRRLVTNQITIQDLFLTQ